jgi:hypothetical protein
MRSDSDERRSVQAVRSALGKIPSELRAALGVRLPSPSGPVRRVVTTGIGASEGPARLLAHRLVSADYSAEFCAVSRFVLDPPAGDLLIVFSQGLSPNACLALGEGATFRDRWLLTSVGYGESSPERLERLNQLANRGAAPIFAPPGEETGMLVRWIGPTVATLLALRLAGSLGAPGCDEVALEDAPERYRPSHAAKLPDRVALVTAGVHVDEAYAHRWKILETLLVSDPSIWDVLQVAHGPLQALHADPHAIVTLERPRGNDLVGRLERTLDPGRHCLVRLRAENDDALAVIEHAAQIDSALLATLEARPRNLFAWPARGGDAPLYELGQDETR